MASSLKIMASNKQEIDGSTGYTRLLWLALCGTVVSEESSCSVTAQFEGILLCRYITLATGVPPPSYRRVWSPRVVLWSLSLKKEGRKVIKEQALKVMGYGIVRLCVLP